MGVSAPVLLALICVNIGSTVSIVVFNKQLLNSHGFTGMGLAFTHYFVQWLLMVVGVTVGAFSKKRIALNIAAKFAFLVALAVTFSNESLNRNSVGFFQLTKMLAIPWTAVLETIFFNKRQSPRAWLALLIIGAGVGLATVSDVRANWVGTMFAVVAFVAAPLGNAYMSYWMQELDVTATQISIYYMPLVTGFLTIPLLGTQVQPLLGGSAEGTVFDGFSWLAMDTSAVFALVLSVSAAFVGNLTTATILKGTSAATFQVISAAKTCCVIGAGMVVFDDIHTASARSLAGLFIGLVGIYWYQFEKRRMAKDVEEGDKVE